MTRTMEIRGLKAEIEAKPILQGIDLSIGTGEVHALMGPNGSGKSTLANVLMGHPAYRVTGGRVLLDGEDFLALETHERARQGVFLAFQYPVEVTGITVGKFLKRAIETRLTGQGNGGKPRSDAAPNLSAGKEGGSEKSALNVTAFIRELRQTMEFMEMDQDFINRYLNQGFSGGEKKRMEILQMLMIKPSFAVLDETDSGLDIDALKVVARGVNRLRGDGFGALIITHYQRILDHIKPDFVHILYKGRIVTSGGGDLVTQLEGKGYEWIREQYGIDGGSYEQPTSRR